MIEDEDAAAALTCGDGGHEARCAGAEDEDVADFFVMSWRRRVRGHAGSVIMSDAALQLRCV